MRSNSSTTMSPSVGSTRSRSANRLQNCASMRLRPSEWGSRPNSGRSSRTSGAKPRLHEGDGRTQQRQRADALGVGEAHLDRDAAAHRVADEVRAVDAELVHHAEDDAGEVAGAVGRRAAWRSRRSPAGRGRGRGSRRARGAAAVSKNDDLVAPRPWMSITSGPSPMVSVEIACGRPGRRGSAAAAGGRPEAEHALEADGEVEIAARVQAALGERLDAVELALAQLEPGLGVRPDRDVGLAAGQAGAHAGAVRRAADLPRAADVAETEVPGGVEAGAARRGSAPGRERKARSTSRVRPPF